MRPLRKLAIGLWVAVFLLAGVWFATNRSAPESPTVESTVNPDVDSAVDSSEPAILKAGDRLPPITLNDLQGKPRSLSDWSGRTRLVNFWATWCAPCRKEMPLLEQFQQSQDPAGLAVIGIAIDRLEPVLRFLGETGVTYPNLAGEMDATRAAEQFGDAFVGLPFSVVVAPDDTILAVHTGEIGPRDLEHIAAAAAGLATGKMTSQTARSALELGLNGDRT